MAEEETNGEKLERLRQRLTVEQRTFCEEFLKTQDPKEAYLAAYDCKDTGSINARAWGVLSRWYIKDYCAALLEGSSVQELLVTQEEVLHTLAGRMRDPDAKDQDRIRAAEVVGKFIGLATTKKLEVTGKEGGAVKHELGLNAKQIAILRADFLGVDPAKLTEGDSE